MHYNFDWYFMTVFVFLFIILCVCAGYIMYLMRPSLALRVAINKNKIIPFYQPVIDSRDRSVFGVEVLARWRLPSGEVMMPDKFMPAAEKKNLMASMTVSLMKQVETDLLPYINLLPRPFHVAVNVNASTFHNPAFLRQCHSFLDAFRDSGVVLILELTEREKIKSVESLSEIFSLLKERNIVIALDDFFSGYSNVKLLNALDVDYLKIDKYFINGVGESGCENILLDGLIEIAHRLEIEVIAEGVENPSQLNYLNGKGVHIVQGYYFSEPVPGGVLPDLLRAAEGGHNIM